MAITRRDMLGIAAKTSLAGIMMETVGINTAEAANAVKLPSLVEPKAKTLKELQAALKRAPRRRNFKEVPMILTSPHQWDDEALSLVMNYKGRVKQVWNNGNLEGPWLNLMRNAMNCQVWSFKNPDFLTVSATHGSAQLALYDQYLWDKYKLAKLTKGKYRKNVFLKTPKAAYDDAEKFENPYGVFSPKDNSIAALQARGAVFLACHNGVFELSYKLHAKGVNPDKLTLPQMVAEFTNHLIDGVVLTPGIVGTLPEMQLKGFLAA